MINMDDFNKYASELSDDEIQKVSAGGMSTEEFLQSYIGQPITRTFKRCSCGNDCGTIVQAWMPPRFRVKCSTCGNIYDT